MKYSAGKWTKWKLLSRDKLIRDYLPNTQQLTKTSFFDFLEHDREVIIKPSNGFGGYGVIQVTKLGNEEYEFHHENKRKIVVGREEAFSKLKEDYCKDKKYIIQQKIPLLKIEECPFDIRVMVQRKTVISDWVITGYLAKVAMGGFIITNMAKEALPLNKAIKQSNIANLSITDLLISEIESISMLSAIHLGEYYPKSRQIGFDIGIDPSGKVWIIEANLKPVIGMFKMLNDKEMIRKIREYRKGI